MKNKFLALLMIGLVACNQNTEEPDKPLVNTETKPESVVINKPTATSNSVELIYKDLDDNEVKLSDYRGKWVVVNFWATWCAPCRKEMPDFVKFKDDYKNQVEIWGIDYEDSDLQTIKNFVKDFEINYPILITDVYNPTEFENTNTKGLPTTVIFNPQGEQHDKRVGPIHYDDLVKITGLTKD